MPARIHTHITHSQSASPAADGSEMGRLLDYLIACLEKESSATTYLQEQSGKVCFLDRYASELQMLIFGDPAYVELPLDQELVNFQKHHLSYHRKDSLYLALKLQSERKGQQQIFTPAYFTEVRLEEVDGCFRISKQDYTPTVNQSLLRGIPPHEMKDILDEIDSQPDWTAKIGAFEAHLDPKVSERLTERPFLFLSGTIKSAQSGLIHELRTMREQQPEQLEKTALGFLVQGSNPAGQRVGPPRIWNIFAMNASQTRAVEYALSHSFTVITGPPGTGKSQVVLNLLANLALNQQTVLFASKNNQAVNTVIEKLEGIQAHYCPFVRIGNKAEKQKGLERLLKGMKGQYPAAPAALPSEQLQRLQAQQKKLQDKLAGLEDLFEQQFALLQRFSDLRSQLSDESRSQVMALLPELPELEQQRQHLHRQAERYRKHLTSEFLPTDHFFTLELKLADLEQHLQQLETQPAKLQAALEDQRQVIQTALAQQQSHQVALDRAQADVNGCQQAQQEAALRLEHHQSQRELIQEQIAQQRQHHEACVQHFQNAIADQPLALQQAIQAFPDWSDVEAWAARCQADLELEITQRQKQQAALEQLLKNAELELQQAEDAEAELRAGLEQIEASFPFGWGETLRLHRQAVLEYSPLQGAAFLTLKASAKALLERSQAAGWLQGWHRRKAQQQLPHLLQGLYQSFGEASELPQLFLMQTLTTSSLQELVDFMDRYPELEAYRQRLKLLSDQSQVTGNVREKRTDLLNRFAEFSRQAPADFCPRYFAELPEATQQWVQTQVPLHSLADIQHQLHRIPGLKPFWDQYVAHLAAIDQAAKTLDESQAQSQALEAETVSQKQALLRSEYALQKARQAEQQEQAQLVNSQGQLQTALDREIELMQALQRVDAELAASREARDECLEQLNELQAVLIELHQAQARHQLQTLCEQFEQLPPALLTDIGYHPPGHYEALDGLLQKLETVMTPLQYLGRMLAEMNLLAQRMNEFDSQKNYRERLAQLQQAAVQLSVETFNASTYHKYQAALVSLEQLLRDYFGQWQEKALLELFKKLSPVVPIWVATNLSTRYNIPLAPELFDYVIVDEASQNDIASILPLLYRAKNVVVIGDPQQLKHIAGIRSRDVELLLEQHGLQAKSIDYHYLNNSAFDLAARRFSEQTDLTPFLLREHYRCHGEIVEFSNRLFYQSKLFAKSYVAKDIAPAPVGIHWQQVAGHYDDKRNLPEARALVAYIRELLQKGLSNEVSMGVITPFRNQELLISRLLLEAGINKGRENDRVFCSTVHRFQGDERDIIFYSPVLAETIRPQTLQWLDSSQDLLNVAVTRARSALIIFGDSRFCEGTQDLHRRLLDYCRQTEQRRHRPFFESETEELFYDALRQRGFVFEYQREVGRYRLDFVLKQPEGYLCVELDGSQHDDNNSYDYSRTRFLEELGYQVKRYRNDEIRQNLDFILQGLALICEQEEPRL